MKKLIYLIIPFSFYCCSPDQQLNNEEAKKMQEKILVADTVAIEESEEEMMMEDIEIVDYEFDNGPVESRESMKILLQNFGLANFSEEDQFVSDMWLMSVQYGEDSILLKPCEYDEQGAFNFNIGSHVDHELAFDLYPLPIIEYGNQDPSYFYIEDIYVYDEGKILELKIKEIHNDQGDYVIDEAEPAIYVTVLRSESNALLDFSNILPNSHFMLESERENLPKAECDEDFY